MKYSQAIEIIKPNIDTQTKTRSEVISTRMFLQDQESKYRGWELPLAVEFFGEGDKVVVSKFKNFVYQQVIPKPFEHSYHFCRTHHSNATPSPEKTPTLPGEAGFNAFNLRGILKVRDKLVNFGRGVAF